jgi:hypothetical protein
VDTDYLQINAVTMQKNFLAFEFSSVFISSANISVFFTIDDIAATIILTIDDIAAT